MAATGWQRRDAGRLDYVAQPCRLPWTGETPIPPRLRCPITNRLSQVELPNGMHTEYTYPPSANLRHGDNMLTKVAPWVDDFQDGNSSGWSGDTGDYSVASGVMENTLHASWWRGVYLSESDADVDLRFDYIRYSSTGTSQAYLRYTDYSNSVYIEFLPTAIRLRQKDGGVLTTLDSISTTVAEDTWYTVRAVADGGDVTVYWGEKGGDSAEILSTASATELTTSRAAYLRAGPNSEHGWDNVQVIAGTLGTSTTFTHNDANELTSTTTNGVTTDYEYDEWGRLVEKDDGTHTATYAYRYGSKLYSVTSDFPGEGNVMYETGGDMKRRSRVAGANETWYNWDDGFVVVSEEGDADGSSAVPERTFIGGREAHVSGAVPASGTWSYYTHDNLWSSRGIWSESRLSNASFDYTPYGDRFIAKGSLQDVTRLYAGHDMDESSSLYYAPFRYYSTDAIRWLVRDPLEMVDGPNLYSFVSANPISYSDPLGLSQSSPQSARSKCRKRLRDALKKLKAICSCADRYTGDDMIGNVGVTPGRDTGWSPRHRRIRIPMSWCDMNDERFLWYVAHEYGHAESTFSRIRYGLDGDFRRNEEDEADRFAIQCLGYDEGGKSAAR